jgi:predicted dienelactone hydrolase
MCRLPACGRLLHMRKLVFLIVMTFLLAAVPASASTALGLPAPTGRHSVGVQELHLVQTDRPDPWFPTETRQLMVSVWYPALPGHQPRAPYVSPALARQYDVEPPLGVRTDWGAIRTHAVANAPVWPGKFPVVLYSPGVGNSRTMGTILAEELASRGYAVVTVDHTYETAVAFPGGEVKTDKAFDIPGSDPAEIEKAKQRMMDAREDDIRFVLDSVRLPMLDLTHVGMLGHSGGGITAGRVMQSDRRVDAGINMDGWFSFGYNRPELGVDRPFMFMGAASSPGLPPLFGKPRTHLSEPDWNTFWRASTGWLLDLNVPAGRHYTYTDAQWLLPQLDGDHTGFIGTADPAAVTNAQRAYVTAFFDQHLKNRPQSLLCGPSPRFPDVSFIR